MPARFTHLHTHSHYSLLEALPQVDKLVKFAKSQGATALALTDNANMFGAIEFAQECEKAGIKPIFGYDAFVAVETIDLKRHRIDDKNARLVLLAETMEGYKNLMKLASVAYLDGFYYRPRIDRNLLRQHGKGLIALAGPRSDIGKALDEENEEKAETLLKEYLDIFGKENFFFELIHQPDSPTQKETNDDFVALAGKHGVGVVASRNVYYLKPEEAEARSLLLCIKDNRTLEERERSVAADNDLSMTAPEEIEEAFKDYPEALENNERIAARCDVKLELGKWNFPVYEIPDGLTKDAYLRKISFEGLQNILKRELNQIEIDRLNYELDIVEKKGYATYFLVVADYASWARKAGIVSTTRGSAAGSLMAFSIGIVTVNPLDFNLPFERFLNPLRPSAPDIDMDFADHRRGEVLQYVKDKYGADRVAQICTFGTMAARGSVRDVGRALGYPVAFCDQLAKSIPFGSQGFAMTIDRALKETPDFKRRYDTEPEVKRQIDLAKMIEGNARHCSVHAAGVVISDRPLVEYTPLQREAGGEAIITQYEMNSVEAAGVLKMDFLGIRNLSILEYAIALAKKTKGAEIDLVHMDWKDKKTFEMLAAGKTMGLFQLNGDGMTKYLMQLKPSKLEDIMAMVALYRPGPIEIIPDFIKRKHNPKLITYLDPRMKEYLGMSYGMLVYQDDVLLTAINLAGYDWLEADKFRKAMGKKIPEEMAKQEIKFKEGVIKNGMTKAKSEELWELIKPFAAYGFNKCLSGDTRIMDPTDGSYPTLRELYERGGAGTVMALREDWKIRPETRFRVVTNGVKPVFDLVTRSGRRIRATCNHPFLTINGWARLDQLKAGHRIALARRLQCGPGLGEDGRKWRALGYLVAEGNLCHPHGVYFYSTKEEEIADFVAQLGAFENCRATIDRSKSAASVYVGQEARGQGNDLRVWLGKLGMLGKKATEKSLPSCVYAMDEAEVSELLAGMWQGDGCVHTKGGGQVFYATSSRALAEQTQHLLLRLGIFATLHTKRFSYRGGQKIGFTVHVSHRENLRRFADTIGRRLLVGKSEALKTILDRIETAYEGTEGVIARGTKDIVPAEVLATIRTEMSASGVGVKAFAAEARLSPRVFGHDARRIGFTRPVIARIADGLKSEGLNDLAASDVYWDEVKAISPAGEEMTYDLEVPGNHNFVANDIVVHNSHAASYAVVAYQTAYMKANFPAEYMTALMTAESGDLDTIALAVRECKAMGIEVLAPDVNSSEAGFTYIDDANIRFGLGAIKNLGEDTVKAIIAERHENGLFKDLADFAGRIPGKAFNKKSLEALAKSGALDALGERRQILENLDVLTVYNKNLIKERDNGQSTLFAFVVPAGTELVPSLGLRTAPPATQEDKLLWEKELLGLYVTAHPFEAHAKEFGDLLTPIAKALEASDRTPIRVGGTVTAVKQIITKKSGEPMLFATITDTSGQAECLVFPSVFKENGAVWIEGANLVVTGKLSRKDDEPKFLADRGWRIDAQTIPVYKAHFKGDNVSSDMMLQMHRPPAPTGKGEVRITLPSKLPPSVVAELKTVLAKYPGGTRVALDVRAENGYQRIETSFLIDPSHDALSAIEKQIGMGNVKVLAGV